MSGKLGKRGNGTVRSQNDLKNQKAVRVEPLEARFCLSAVASAVAAVECPAQIVMPATRGQSSAANASTATTTAAASQPHQLQQFHFESHEFHATAHPLPGHSNYVVMSVEADGDVSAIAISAGSSTSAPAEGWSHGMMHYAGGNGAADAHESHVEHDFNGAGGGPETHFVGVGASNAFIWHLQHDAQFIIKTGVTTPVNPTYPTQPLASPDDSVVVAPPIQQPPAYDQTGSGQSSTGSGSASGAGSSSGHSIARASHGSTSSTGSLVQTILGRTNSGNEIATTIQPVATTTNSFAASSVTARQPLTSVIDTTSATSATGLRAAVLSLGPSASDRFSMTSVANTVGGAIFKSVLPEVRFTVPSAADMARDMEAAAAQAVARVVVTSQPTFEFAHMGSPFALVADSLGAFIEDSASIPTAIARPTHSQAPWMLTFAVVAADVVVLTYMHRRRVITARRRLATTLP